MTFDPTQFGFVRLRDFRIADSVPVYEYKNHPAVDGTKDFLRLNLYLTVDGTYVTIWHGLLEPLFAEAEFAEGRLASVATPTNVDFMHSYNENLFRGYIDSAETAEHIFKALRVGEGRRYALPSMLTSGSDNMLTCRLMEKID
ncbi:MAG TPA: hypothetical protein VEK73_16360 [Xanthobacteraceae bacterium]|nr:hypothetical protein [Xanthobacteraceae bacterium]